MITLDPTGDVYGLPTYPWRAAPAGLATRRQLAALGLRPGGQAPAAQIMRLRRRRPADPLVGYLYTVAGARPKRTPTPAVLAAVRTALRARQRCGGACGRQLDYIPAARAGLQCWDCYDARSAVTA